MCNIIKNSQEDKFKQAARDLETNNDEKRFNDMLGKIAKPPPDGIKTKPKTKPA